MVAAVRGDSRKKKKDELKSSLRQNQLSSVTDLRWRVRSKKMEYDSQLNSSQHWICGNSKN